MCVVRWDGVGTASGDLHDHSPGTTPDTSAEAVDVVAVDQRIALLIARHQL